MRLFPSLLIGAALLGASAAALAADRDNSKNEAKLTAALAGRVAGKPVDCISLRDIRSSQIIDDTAIVYDTGGGRLFVNRPRIGAESLDRHKQSFCGEPQCHEPACCIARAIGNSHGTFRNK